MNVTLVCHRADFGRSRHGFDIAGRGVPSGSMIAAVRLAHAATRELAGTVT